MEGSIKDGVTTPLDAAGLPQETLQRLAAVSVTTAEELLGIIRADPAGTQALLGTDDLSSLASDVAGVAEASSAPDLGEAPDETYWTGALAPEGVDQGPVSLDDVLAAGGGSAPSVAPEAGAPSQNFISCFGPVLNQGTRSTCVAFATCALTECLEGRAGSGGPPQLSEQYQYFNCKQNDGSPNTPGTFVSTAMQLLVSDGTCPDSDWPYDPNPIPGNEGEGPAPADAAAAAAGHRLATQTDQGSRQNRNSQNIRDALDDQLPVALSVPVFPNWVGNPALKLYGFIPMPNPSTAPSGGHAMCAAGYAFDPQFAGGGYFILRNSWGTGFAPQSPVEAGYALLPFAYWDTYGWEAFSGTV